MTTALIIGIIVIMLLIALGIIGYYTETDWLIGLSIACTCATAFLYFMLFGTVVTQYQTKTEIKPIIYTLPDRKLILYDGIEQKFTEVKEYNEINDSTCTFYLVENFNMYRFSNGKYITYTPTK